MGYDFGNTMAFTIGRNAKDSNQYFGGNIDEVRIWSDIRTEAEIRTNMFTTVAVDSANLRHYYDCDYFHSSKLEDTATSTTGQAHVEVDIDLYDGSGTASDLWAPAPTFDAESEGAGTYSVHKFSKGSGTQYIYGLNGIRLDSVEITSGSTVKLETINDSGGELKIYGVLTATGNLQSGTTASNSKVSFWTGGLTHVVGSAANSLSGLYKLEMSNTSGTVTLPACTIKRLEVEGSGGTTSLGGDLTVNTGHLQVTNGTLNTGSDRALTVAGDIHIDGTLTGNSSTISTQSVHIDGTFTHDGALTCTHIASTNYAFQNLGTWTPGSNQTTTFTGDGEGTYHVKSNDWNDVVINASGEQYIFRPKTGTGITFVGDLTVTAGNMFQNSNSDSWSVGGNVLVSDDTLGLSTTTGDLSFGSLTIAS